MTGAQALDTTTGDGQASRGGSIREPTVLNQACAAPLPEMPGDDKQDADMTRTTLGDRSSQTLFVVTRCRA